MSKLETYSTIELLTREWEELADRAGASPFVRPAWVSAWWHAFGDGRLEVLALRNGRQLAAVLPMRRAFGKLISPANWHTPHFGPVAEAPEAWEELAERLFTRAERRVDLAFVEDGPVIARGTAVARGAGRLVRVRTLARSPYAVTEGDCDEYLSRLSKNRRKDVRRLSRRLEQVGEVALDVHREGEHLATLLHEAFAVEATGWKGQSKTAIASRPNTLRFYSDIARWAAERGWLRLSFLRLDGRPLAFDLSLQHDGAYYSLKSGYDTAYSKYSPGILLLHRLITSAFRSDVSTFELLGGEEEYKLEWATAARNVVLMQAFTRSPTGFVEWAAAAYGRPAAKKALGVLRR